MLCRYLKFPWHPRVTAFEGEHVSFQSVGTAFFASGDLCHFGFHSSCVERFLYHVWMKRYHQITSLLRQHLTLYHYKEPLYILVRVTLHAITLCLSTLFDAGSTQYTVDDNGLVALHDESWSISPVTALIESFTPSFK